MTAARPGALSIRTVTLADLESLIDVYLDTAIHHASVDPAGFRVPARDDVAVRLRRRIEGRGAGAEYVAAMVDGRMVGSASVNIQDPLHPGNMMRPVPAAEFGVSVLEDWRGRGIGRALIQHVEGWAADRGIERMLLSVSEGNEGAIRLYRSIGYAESGREMRKDLTAPNGPDSILDDHR